MKYSEIQEKLQSIISSSIFSRLFFWSKITLKLGELSNLIESLIINNSQISLELENLNKKVLDLETNFQTEKKINQKLETEIEIVKNKNELLNPLKLKNTELLTELNKLKQEELAKDAKRDSLMNKWEQFQTSAEQRERKKEEIETQKANEEKEQIKRQWLNHEENVNNLIKIICNEKGVEFIEKDKWPYKKQPDNIIKICDEYIVFDAKSPRNEELDNFPKYIRTQIDTLAKYAQHKDVKKQLFLVIPENALHVIQNKTYEDSNYCVHIVSPQSLRITIWSLKQIEHYEFAEKLSPEDRENLARAFAGSMNYIKRVIQINSDMNEHGIELTERMLQLISKKSLDGIRNKALEYEKGDIVNASQQRGGKSIDLKEESVRQKDIKSKAVNHEIIPTNNSSEKKIHLNND